MRKIVFNNCYARLGDEFYISTLPEPVKEPGLIKFNHELASELGLSETVLYPKESKVDGNAESTAIFAGNILPAGAEPLAMAYAGHQFGHFNQQLGDGRAIQLGEIDSPDGRHFDLQLKGSGRTIFSRNGDGRAALGPVLREYLMSEAMAKLGVPTTRALAVVTTGEEVARERLVPGGIITRVATSFVRVGTFQYFAAKGNVDAIKKLADFVIERNHPHAQEANNSYLALLQSIIERQAVLIAQWMNIGFIHGVMNTDNMSIAGETIDYGPCAFMDYFDFDQVYSSIDRDGRYAYSNQPSIGLWNLTRLAETLLPLLADETDIAVEIAKEGLNDFVGLYQQNRLDGMRAKLGLITSHENDKILIDDLLDIMDVNKADFTLTFYYLSLLGSSRTDSEKKLQAQFKSSEQIDSWVARWRKRFSEDGLSDESRQEKMLSINPVYIPRNHQIESAIRAAEDNNDFSVFHNLHEVLQKPYQLQNEKEQYMQPPKPDEVVEHTFCGT